MRLITFGCSFTDYSWPTWADIIADDLGCEYENWAIGGGGNQQIARRALYRWSRGLDKDDVIMIQWSSINREDRFIEGHWRAEGSVVNSPTYSGDFFRDHWDWDNDVINTAHSRITTELLLGHHLKYQMAMSWTDGDQTIMADRPHLTRWWQSRVSAVDTVPSATACLQGRTADGHPDPEWWLKWVETRIYPRFGWHVKERTRERVLSLQQQLQDLADRGWPHSRIQQQANLWMNQQGWQTRKVKPQSDTLTPGQGSDILM